MEQGPWFKDPADAFETTSETTRLLVAWSTGDEEALPRVMARVYDELRRIAAGYLRHERQDHTRIAPTSSACQRHLLPGRVLLYLLLTI